MKQKGSGSVLYRKRKKQFILVLTAGLLLLLLCGCGAEKKTDAPGYTRLEELEDKRIGVTTGSVQAIQTEERFPNATFYYFSTSVDCLEALKSHKIDAYADAEALVKYMMAENPDLTCIEERLASGMQAGAAFPKTERGRELCEQYSEFVRNIKQSGVYDEICSIWYGPDESLRVVPDLYNLPGPNGTLRIAGDTTCVPFLYIKDGKTVGVDVDILVHFCREYGYKAEIVAMDFPAILPAVTTGKCDFAFGGIAITPERAESVCFSEPTYEGGSLVAVLKDSESEEGGGILASIVISFEKTFLREDRWQLFLKGTGNTLLITLFSILFGTLLGFAVYLLCRNGNRIANKVTEGCIWLVEGMPMVVLLMILYYIVFRRIGISGLVVSVIGFTLTFGASMYGMLCSGVKAVDRGQTEAARALGYSDRKTFFRIILPQAAIHFMPSYKGQVVALLKATAVVGYIAVQDLTKMGDIVRSRTYEAFFPLIAVTVIYFLLGGLLIRIVGWVIRKIDPKNRKPEQILKGVKTHD
ncbi:MAG: ABC transporter permease subunit [Oscillospiraceae bacterium]|nr:ABC transporter permease subunit [Oscillospiraceae bacterium]